MKKEIESREFEYYLRDNAKGVRSDYISIYNWQYDVLSAYFHKEINLSSTLFILVQNGNGEIFVNNKSYEIGQKDVMLLSFGHFFKIANLSRNFTCVAMYVSREFAQNMFSSDMLYKRVKYGNKMYKSPLQKFGEDNFDLLQSRIDFIRSILMQRGHLYREEQILNSLRIFFLDLINIIEQNIDNQEIKTSMDEVYFQKFLDLLGLAYRREHVVDYYAEKINISPHYLTLIVKKFTGQTASDFIYQLLLSESKNLLMQRDISIQEIAFHLNFSDQSAFGKFFKRKTGFSPKEYRIID